MLGSSLPERATTFVRLLECITSKLVCTYILGKSLSGTAPNPVGLLPGIGLQYPGPL